MWQGIALALAVISISYFLVMLRLHARPRTPAQDATSARPFHVLVVPCLNEERVLRTTLDSLMRLPADRCHVLVVDDGSEDDTVAIARSYPPARVSVLRRQLPEARRGKGDALNAAFRHITRRWADDPAELVVGVVDADGRLEPDALEAVDRELADPTVGAVQVGVRILNRPGLVGRFQDLEFASFSAIVQTARHHIGSVGLGGNGQFTRAAALASVSDTPWSACLTEDLDLGISLVLRGWRIAFTSRTWVSQQGLASVPALVRQRTRWVHGHFQCWRRIPAIFMSDLPNRTVFDLLYYLFTPALMLLASILYTVPAATMLVLLALGRGIPTDAAAAAWLAGWYLMSFGMSLALCELYRRQVRDVSVARALLLAHGSAVYNLIWYVAGWKALLRIARGRHGWVKTSRLEEPAAVNA